MTWHAAVEPFRRAPLAPPQARIGLPPSRNSTYPLGLPPPELAAFTVAVYVMGWPVAPGLTEGTTVVVVWVVEMLNARVATSLAGSVTVIVWLPGAETVMTPLEGTAAGLAPSST